MRELICGKPSMLIYRGKINEEVLKKERFTINELQERLRGNNIVNIADVEYAILETNGEVTVIQKPNKRNTIPEDFNIMPEYEGIPYDLVIDGVIMNDNLKAIGKNYIFRQLFCRYYLYWAAACTASSSHRSFSGCPAWPFTQL